MSAHPYLPSRARITAITPECGGDRPIRTYCLTSADGQERPFTWRPGQCVQMSVMGAGEVMLSIASAAEESEPIELSVMRVGLVTGALHQLEVGDHVGLRGPYGNGFPVDRWHGADLVMIGGGIGQAPIRALLHHALAHRERFGRIRMFYGARTPAAMIYGAELDRLAARTDLDLYLSIDPLRGPDGPLESDAADGWPRALALSPIPPDVRRFTGLVPEVVEAIAPAATGAIAVTCGPPAMIAAVVAVLGRLGFAPEQIFTTLERRMKCGIGLCGRCNLGSRFVCTDGPVFSQAQLLELPEAFA